MLNCLRLVQGKTNAGDAIEPLIRDVAPTDEPDGVDVVVRGGHQTGGMEH